MSQSDMTHPWGEHQPIYKQLRERIVGLLLSGAFKEGQSMPSIRQLASECQINHLTVSKAYQELVDIGLLEIKRGQGMYVAKGAATQLMHLEREKFMHLELPHLIKRAHQLGISKAEICEVIMAHTAQPTPPQE
ncbi:MAG TPA: GntR family transcriptional regulator [Cellvibrionaceae bacterium]|nr:GntR family transcriptional regulator [Cellvibrionaceae bacterium]